MTAQLPVVAVVGRPNVGKSTLVNRIVGSREAVVDEMPGVTRDRREFVAEWAGRRFVVVDTGGWESTRDEPLAQAVRHQAEAAVGVADVVLFVVDVATSITEEDAAVASMLRRSEVPVVLVANKADSPAREVVDTELWRLGLGEPTPISALHGRGVGDLLDRVVEACGEAPPVDEGDDIPDLAIVGRPNVGKSTLLNRLAGEERVIVSERPGTTRDPIDVVVELDGRTVRLIDTAGIRRAPRIPEEADYYSVLRARRALERADVALLLIDAPEGVTQQDQRIADLVGEAGVGLVILLNKWDRVDDEARERVEGDIARRLGFVGWAPVLRISAKTGARLHRLATAVDMVLENRRRRIPTGRLNRLIRDWVGAHPPPTRRGRRPKILYAVQAGIEPPTFVVFVSGGELGPDYLRFLERRLREEADFTGTPIHVVARRRSRERP